MYSNGTVPLEALLDARCGYALTVSLNSLRTMDCRLSQYLEKQRQRLFIVFYPNPHYDMYRTVR